MQIIRELKWYWWCSNWFYYLFIYFIYIVYSDYLQWEKYFYIKDDSIPKKVGTFIDFEGWLNRLFTKIGKAPILIPDTNKINKKYYSNFIKVLIETIKSWFLDYQY